MLLLFNYLQFNFSFKNYDKVAVLIQQNQKQLMDLSFQKTDRFCLNLSTSKQQYSFPKCKRFKEEKNNKLKLKFYTLPSSIQFKREKAPSFPKFTRKLLFPNQRQKRIIPSPSSYSIKSDIDESINYKKGITFPRQIKKLSRSQFTPGPANYSPKKQQFLTARYTIGKSSKKLEFPLQLQKGKQSPGPAYLVNVSKLEKIISNYVQKKCLKVYSSRSNKRISKTLNLNPEKSYQQDKFINKQKDRIIYKRQSISMINLQKSILFKQRTLPTILGKFGKAERKTIFNVKNRSPGPEYNRFSEFSRLQKKVYKERRIIKNSLKNQNYKLK